MATRIRPTTDQANDLVTIRQMSGEQLVAVQAALDSDRQPIIAASELLSEIKKVIPIKEQATALARLLITLADYTRSLDRGPADIFDRIIEGLRLRDDWNDNDIDELSEHKKVFTALLKTESVSVSSKAIRLSYDFQNVLNGARIITDIRPIFRSEKDTIVGGIVTQTIKIEYSSLGEWETISLSLDNEDIEKLKISCEEALHKAQECRSLIKEKCNLPTFNSGEEKYGFE